MLWIDPRHALSYITHVSQSVPCVSSISLGGSFQFGQKSTTPPHESVGATTQEDEMKTLAHAFFAVFFSAAILVALFTFTPNPAAAQGGPPAPDSGVAAHMRIDDLGIKLEATEAELSRLRGAPRRNTRKIKALEAEIDALRQELTGACNGFRDVEACKQYLKMLEEATAGVDKEVLATALGLGNHVVPDGNGDAEGGGGYQPAPFTLNPSGAEGTRPAWDRCVRVKRTLDPTPVTPGSTIKVQTGDCSGGGGFGLLAQYRAMEAEQAATTERAELEARVRLAEIGAGGDSRWLNVFVAGGACAGLGYGITRLAGGGEVLDIESGRYSAGQAGSVALVSGLACAGAAYLFSGD